MRMRPAGWVVLVWLALGLSGTSGAAPAYPYRFRTRSGAIIFANAPSLQDATRWIVRNVFVPRDNIEGGCRHLCMLLDRYRGNVPLAVAAYNAGTRTVEDAGGIPAIPETREYVGRVLRYRQAYQREAIGSLASRR